MKSRMLASLWAYRGQSLFGQRHYLKALRSFELAKRWCPDTHLPALWQGYYALTLFYSEDYVQALPLMEQALFGLRTLKTSSREAYWLTHEILARLKEANLAHQGQTTNPVQVADDLESQG
jgi:tetratricopeptide (TPR) repeat protein